MELDQLKYKRHKNSIGSMLLHEKTIERITTQKSGSLLDRIDLNLKKNMRYCSVLVVLFLAPIIYHFDSTFWGYYFIFGSLIEAILIYTAYKLRKNIHQYYETDLSLRDRFKEIKQLITTYLSFSNLTRVTLYLILIIAFSLKNIESFNLVSIFQVSVLIRLGFFGLIFYFIHRSSFKKFAKPHQDMLVDLQYYIAELGESSIEVSDVLPKRNSNDSA